VSSSAEADRFEKAAGPTCDRFLSALTPKTPNMDWLPTFLSCDHYDGKLAPFGIGWFAKADNAFAISTAGMR
jgi:hypothetical protein